MPTDGKIAVEIRLMFGKIMIDIFDIFFYIKTRERGDPRGY
jgi:hypothetical protein